MSPLVFALVAALLFGAATPASKILLQDLTPLQLAGLLYLGAALGTAPLVLRERSVRKRASRIDARSRRMLWAAVALGGVVGPVLLLCALRLTESGSVALLLNLELLATAVLGVAMFREHIGRSGWIGIGVGFASGALVSVNGGLPGIQAGLLAAGACVAWGMDNHLTALIDGITPAETTMWKGLVAGSANLALGLAATPLGAERSTIVYALGLGVASYGASIVLYVLSAQRLGATRAQAAFATAPFLGAGLSFALLDESLTWMHVAAGVGLIAGVVLLFLDRHEHEHTHAACEHIHSHAHDDEHHDHVHPGLPPSTRHTHVHAHMGQTHSHRHLPDLHHRHSHRERLRRTGEP